MMIKKVSCYDVKKTIGTTNWKAVKLMTDEQIKNASISDPISKELRVDQLMEFKREGVIK